MEKIKLVLLLLIAILHLFFMVLEMFFWDKPYGLKMFRMTQDQAKESKVLAQNQGLYNGFLAAGLIWAAVWENQSVAMFFLTCVSLAGIFGAYSTRNFSIFYIQGLPALVTAMIILFT